MEEKKVNIRVASPEDAEELLAIYAPYVEHTAITFEYEVPSLLEFRERICHVLEKYPYLAAEVDYLFIMGCGSNQTDISVFHRKWI